MKNAVITLWKAGLTSGQIATELNITRNQVAGHIWRAQRDNEIPKRLTQSPPRPKVKPEPRVKKVTVAKVVMPVMPTIKVEPELPAEPPAKKFKGFGTKTILDLGPDDCRWLYDNGLYCGERTEEYIRPWCPEHRALVYVKTAKPARPFRFG